MDDRLQKYNEMIMATHKEASAPVEKPKEVVNTVKMDAINNSSKKESYYSNNPSVTKENNKNAYSAYAGYNGYTGNNSNVKSSSNNNSSGYNYYSGGFGNNNQQTKSSGSLDYQTRKVKIKKKAEEKAKQNKQNLSSGVYSKSSDGFGSFKVKDCKIKTRDSSKIAKQLTATTVSIIGEAALGALLMVAKTCLGEITESVKNIMLNK